ncbi:tripartite tricarboxylate transporter substrate binding protein [Magnetospira sp. QH-2]|uniref:Bug family tripartite tricarboxylate transporter substrate binding protein n=1 Tax=Magnetospira sp. (strain QH-2) TaxID=1288970 RepID=UPI0003E819AD|nr:tripartite tricarboxylate transporter substrate binding protein [Magnetospira sp. QH-2]CCQ75242.1 conserved exported protein of unknown function [Magnetospira sp. QH-2]
MKQFIWRATKSAAAVAVAFGLSLGILASPSQAEFPTKPIKLMVGFSAGGGTDVYARALSSFVYESLGMPFVVVNKPGASGMVAAQAVKRAAPDGYTLYVISAASFSTRELIDGDKAPVKALEDFQPLGVIGQLVSGLIVPVDSPFNNAKELVDFAKSHPGKLRWSNPGKTSSHTIAGLGFLDSNGIKATSVPFKGGSKARNAVASKQVDFGFMGIQLLAGFESKLKSLGVASTERDGVYKNVPTFGEQSLANLDLAAPMVIWGHKDLPKDVATKLSQAIKAAATNKGYPKLIKKTGAVGYYKSPEEGVAIVKNLMANMKPIVDANFTK